MQLLPHVQEMTSMADIGFPSLDRNHRRENHTYSVDTGLGKAKAVLLNPTTMVYKLWFMT